MTEEQLDRQCVERCLRGDLEAFGPLIDRYQRPVFRAVFRVVGNYEDAREVSQQAFMKAFEHLHDYDPSRRFFSWLYRIAMNESINFVHARRSFAPLDDQQEGSLGNPLETFEVGERQRQVRDAVMNLSDTYRSVVILRHFFHCSYQDTAEVLDLPEKTVKSRLFAARQLLREALATQEPSKVRS